MAIRFLKKKRPSPWQVYWNNPITGKREAQTFTSKEEAEKFDSLIKHRIRFEPEYFQPVAQEDEDDHNSDNVTLDFVYLEYLKRKQFNKKKFPVANG